MTCKNRTRERFESKSIDLYEIFVAIVGKRYRHFNESLGNHFICSLFALVLSVSLLVFRWPVYCIRHYADTLNSVAVIERKDRDEAS